LPTLYINGKFMAQSVTGVQRAAHEMVLALDRAMVRGDVDAPAQCVLLCPPGAQAFELKRIQVRRWGLSLRSLQAWEQLVLPWAVRRGVLLNLSGSAPWWAPQRSVCMLHDAAVFDHPQAYTRAFRAWYQMLFGHLGRRALGLVTVSAFSRSRLSQALGTPAERFTIVRHGADHFQRVQADASVLGAYGLVPGRFLLVVGTAKQTKNVESVLAAWRRLATERDCALVWVGGVNTRVFSSAHMHVDDAAADAAARILHIGVITDERLKALYENAAGLVIASRYEGFGFPAVEAMVCGCPVAAASAAALPEVCADAALFFDPESLESIGEAMSSLITDADLRARLRQRGLEHAATFTWDGAAQRLLQSLRALRVAQVQPA
jgi:glycosyltransferase involved in cell wall biosynthesis